MATYAEAVRNYEAILSDQGQLSYDNVTIGVGADLTAGAVLGLKKVVQAAAPIPAVVNASGAAADGTMTLLTFGPDVQVGSYVIQCTAAVAHGGTFSVTAPDGTALPAFTMGTTTGGTARYTSSHLSFSLTDGSTDFHIASSFTVAVTAAGTPVSAGGNGNSAMSAITLGKYAQLGTYKVVCTSTGSHTATYIVIAPDGQTIPNTVDGLFGYASSGGADAFVSDHVNFTITDGSTDNVVGTYFNIIVASQASVTGRYFAYDPTAVDGTQDPVAVLVEPAAAASTAASAKAMTRLGEVKSAMLAWKSTVSAAQKLAAAKQLLANSLIAVRS
jgi:hypothetical protein